MAIVDFDKGGLYGPVIKSIKTDLETLAYGSLYGPVVGEETESEPSAVETITSLSLLGVPGTPYRVFVAKSPATSSGIARRSFIVMC